MTKPDPIPALVEALRPLTATDMKRLAAALIAEAAKKRRFRSKASPPSAALPRVERARRQQDFLALCQKLPTEKTADLAKRAGISRSVAFALRAERFPDQLDPRNRLKGAVAALHRGVTLKPATHAIVQAKEPSR